MLVPGQYFLTAGALRRSVRQPSILLPCRAMVTVHSSTDDTMGKRGQDPVQAEARLAKIKAKAEAEVMTAIEREESRLRKLAEQGDTESQFILGLSAQAGHVLSPGSSPRPKSVSRGSLRWPTVLSSGSTDITATTANGAVADHQAGAGGIRDIRQQQRDNNKLRPKVALAEILASRTFAKACSPCRRQTNVQASSAKMVYSGC